MTSFRMSGLRGSEGLPLRDGIDILRCIWKAHLPRNVNVGTVENEYENVASFLEAALVSKWHLPNSFFSREDVLFIRELTWMSATYLQLERLRIFEKEWVQNTWRCTAARCDSTIGPGYFQEK